MSRKCKCCGDRIDENVTFQSDDEEIFKAVMFDVMNKDICIECALTNAVIEQWQKENSDFCEDCGETACGCFG